MNRFISEVLSSGEGNPSTMRVLTAIIVCVVVGVWAVVSVRSNSLQPISLEQASLVLGSLGIKAWQRGKENPTASETETVTMETKKTNP